MTTLDWIRPLRHRDEQILSELYVRRFGRVLMYSGLVLSGVFLIIEPSQLTVEQVGKVWALAWAVGIIIGAVISLYGAIRDEWIGEFSGIPLLAAALGMYGLSALAGVDDSGVTNYVLLAFGFIVLSFTAGLCARWRDVQNIMRLSLHGVNQNKGG